MSIGGKPRGEKRERRAMVYQHDEPELSTRQEFKEDCDVNRIIERARKGIAPGSINKASPMYGDVSGVPQLAEAYALVERAEEAFAALPAKLRKELDNDPVKFLDAPRELLEEHGLLKPQAPSLAPGPGVEGVEPPPSPSPQTKGKKTQGAPASKASSDAE